MIDVGFARGQSPESEGSGSASAADDRVTSDGSSLATGNDALKLAVPGQVSRGLLLHVDGHGTGAIRVDEHDSSIAGTAASHSFAFDRARDAASASLAIDGGCSVILRGIGPRVDDPRLFEKRVTAPRHPSRRMRGHR